MAFDFGAFVQEIGDKVANLKGYTDLEDLAIGAAAKNVARITDKPNEIKQTPPVQTPTPYTKQLLSEINGTVSGLTSNQMLIIGGLGVAALVIYLRR